MEENTRVDAAVGCEICHRTNGFERTRTNLGGPAREADLPEFDLLNLLLLEEPK